MDIPKTMPRWMTGLIQRNDAMNFCSDLLVKTLTSGLISRTSSILVVCGTDHDREALPNFSNVTISNISGEGDCVRQDAEDLTYADNTFDFVLINAGLHHCRSPHRALLEMYRVSKRGILIVEARDGLLMKLALRLRLAQEYELCAVVENGLNCGGVRNTHIPNFVYRWTEREIYKTVASYTPEREPRISFFYDFRFPFVTFAERPRIFLYVALMLYPLVKLTTRIFPKQSNLFGVLIEKDTPLMPWLESETALNEAWVEQHYKRS